MVTNELEIILMNGIKQVNANKIKPRPFSASKMRFPIDLDFCMVNTSFLAKLFCVLILYIMFWCNTFVLDVKHYASYNNCGDGAIEV